MAGQWCNSESIQRYGRFTWIFDDFWEPPFMKNVILFKYIYLIYIYTILYNIYIYIYILIYIIYIYVIFCHPGVDLQ